jgi:hypothetical protein
VRPKKWGGLEIKDIEKFSKAIRLRWLWYGWDNQDIGNGRNYSRSMMKQIELYF